MDRSSVAQLKVADETLIEGTIREFGNREKAGAAFVEQGFKLYRQDDLAGAMRRFNQAWLLNPNNPEVYWGFASVLQDQGKNCEAMKMAEKSLALNSPTYQGIYPDAAQVITLCAVSDKTVSQEVKAKLFKYSEELYRKAEEVEPNKRYVYGSWATAYYWRGQYAEAWSMVAKERASGGKPGEKFLALLREKTPEPATK